MKAATDVTWSERTREEFAAWAKRGAVVVVPIGAVEQHGLALPTDTDIREVAAVAVAGARRAKAPVLVTPVIPFSISPHHMMYAGGTITLRVETFLRLVSDVCESIVSNGFDRILLLNGHGGNMGAVEAAALELRSRLGRQIQSANWWELARPVFADVCTGPVTHTIGHAGESEASCVLALSPTSVRRELLELVPGVTDNPARGSAAKGRRILAAGAAALARRVEEMAARSGRDVVGIPCYETRGTTKNVVRL
jgi:creatinine amidohydrolase